MGGLALKHLGVKRIDAVPLPPRALNYTISCQPKLVQGKQKEQRKSHRRCARHATGFW